MKFFKVLFILLITLGFANANSILVKDLNDQNISINLNSFRIIEFNKMIENIKVSDKATLEVDFNDDESKPLKSIKIFGKKVGNGNMLVTFIDSTTLHINVNIVRDLFKVIEIAKNISPNLIVRQANNKVILDGTVKNQKAKNKILELFTKSGIDVKTDLVDLVELENPSKMIRLKLYAVEISNNNGKDIKNNWVISSRNFVNSNDLRYVSNINTTNSPDAQQNPTLATAADTMMANAVSLSGGLTAAANYLGRYFNAAVTLNYLTTKGYANVLDETTLLTLENQDATFHAGGTIYLKIATTTDQGVPTTQVQDINYGLQLDIKAQNVVNDEYVSLNIVTKSTGIDWVNTVDDIPSFTEKSIETNVVVGNKSTIILGGLISSDSSETINKIPVLGDIPLLGKLFTSKSFKEGKSELVFFITPEIVDAQNTNNIEDLAKKTAFKKDINKQ